MNYRTKNHNLLSGFFFLDCFLHSCLCRFVLLSDRARAQAFNLRKSLRKSIIPLCLCHSENEVIRNPGFKLPSIKNMYFIFFNKNKKPGSITTFFNIESFAISVLKKVVLDDTGAETDTQKFKIKHKIL